MLVCRQTKWPQKGAETTVVRGQTCADKPRLSSPASISGIGLGLSWWLGRTGGGGQMMMGISHPGSLSPPHDPEVLPQPPLLRQRCGVGTRQTGCECPPLHTCLEPPTPDMLSKEEWKSLHVCSLHSKGSVATQSTCVQTRASFTF